MKRCFFVGLLACITMGCGSSDDDSGSEVASGPDAAVLSDTGSSTDSASGADLAVAGDLAAQVDLGRLGDSTVIVDAATTDGATTDGATAADAAGPDAAAVVAAPLLLSVRLVQHGTMALAWTNPDPQCDTIVINRNKNGGPYTPAQTITGAATSANDSPGHMSGTYCYTLTCTLGAATSAPSDERCAEQ